MVPPASHRIPRARRYSGYTLYCQVFVYETITPYGLTSHSVPLTLSSITVSSTPEVLLLPVCPCFPFARRYLENHCYFLILRLRRCFSSPGSLRVPMDSVHDDSALPLPGFPIRKSADQRLFATTRSLSQLVTSFFGSWCQGIHPTLLLAWSWSFRFWSILKICFVSSQLLAKLFLILPLKFDFLAFGCFLPFYKVKILNHVRSPQPQRYCYLWFGLFPFRSPLLRKSMFLSLPPPT